MTDASPPTHFKDPGPFWDEKFKDEALFYGDRPNAWLVDQSYRIPPGGRVLVPGDGEGRNGVWLARQGLTVTSVDASPRALQKAAKLALDTGVSLRTACADLRDWDWPEAAFDAVVSIFLHFRPDDRPSMHQAMVRALKPGGLLILEAFTPAHSDLPTGGPPVVEVMMTLETLDADLPGVAWLEREQGRTRLHHGTGFDGEADTVRVAVARA